MFYTEHHEDSRPLAPSYRHLLIKGATDAPKHFYHLNAEHAIADANVEVLDSAAVYIYSLKSEGRVRARVPCDSVLCLAELGVERRTQLLTPGLFTVCGFLGAQFVGRLALWLWRQRM